MESGLYLLSKGCCSLRTKLIFLGKMQETQQESGVLGIPLKPVFPVSHWLVSIVWPIPRNCFNWIKLMIFFYDFCRLQNGSTKKVYNFSRLYLPPLSNLISQCTCVFLVVCFWQIQCSLVAYRRKFVHL